MPRAHNALPLPSHRHLQPQLQQQQMDTSIFTRKVRRPSGLPTPVERSTTPISRPRTGPPPKDHRVFRSTSYTKSPSPSAGEPVAVAPAAAAAAAAAAASAAVPEPSSASASSSASSEDKGSAPERVVNSRGCRVLAKFGSAGAYHCSSRSSRSSSRRGLLARNVSLTSVTGSAASLSTSASASTTSTSLSASSSSASSSAASRFGSPCSAHGHPHPHHHHHHHHHTPSVLGISLPATSASSLVRTAPATTTATSSSNGGSGTARQRSGSLPRLLTQDPLVSAAAAAPTTYGSSPPTRHTDPPFSLTPSPFSPPAETPASAASLLQSPASSAAPLQRAVGSSPSRQPPVVRRRAGSLSSSIDRTDPARLDSVRESTTSTSSDSTVRAADRAGARGHSHSHSHSRSRSSSNSKISLATPPRTRTTPATTAATTTTTTTTTTAKQPKLAPSPMLVTSKRSASPAPARSRWGGTGVNSLGIPARTATAAAATGLGLSIPSTAAAAAAATVLTKSRSRSIGSPFSFQPKLRKDAATPPLPLSGSQPPHPHAPRTKTVGVTQGLPYSNMPKASSPSTVANPPRPTPTTTTPIIKPGFFSRGRTNSEEKQQHQQQQQQQQQQQARRGPTAGTGYEGYGSFGRASRARSGSTSNTSTTSSRRGRSGSQTSTTSAGGSRPASRASADMDDYFVERLKPVVIVGGEVVENHNKHQPAEMVRSGSSPAVMESRPSSRQQQDHATTSSTTAAAATAAATTASHSHGKHDRAVLGGSLALFARGGSPADSPSHEPGRESVAGRRAHGPGRTVTPIPAPINTSGHRGRPAPSPADSLASVASSRMQAADFPDLAPALSSSAPTASAKPKSKRWNFFQKSSHPKISSAPPPPPPTAPPPAVPAAAPRSTTRRPVPAHYALLDHDEQREAQELVERMHELRQKRDEAPVPTAAAPPAVNYIHTLRKQQVIQFAEDTKPSAPAAPTGRSYNPMLLPPYRDPAAAAARRASQAKVEGAKGNTLRKREAAPPHSKSKSGDNNTPAPVEDAPTPGRALSRLLDAPTLNRQEEFQVNWDGYGLTPTAAPSGEEKSKTFVEYDPLDIRGRRPSPAAATAATATAATPSPAPSTIPAPPPSRPPPPAAAAVTPPPLSEWPVRSHSISTPGIPEVAPAREEDAPLLMAEEPEVHAEDFYSELEGLYGFSTQPPTPAVASFAAPSRSTTLKRSNTMRSTTSSLGSPFQYADLCSPLQFEFDSPKLGPEPDHHHDADGGEGEEGEEGEEEEREGGEGKGGGGGGGGDEVEVDGEGDGDCELGEEDTESAVFSLDSPTLPPVRPTKHVPESIPIISCSTNFLIGPEQPLPFTPSAAQQGGIATPATPFSISSFIRYYGETDSQRGISLALSDPITHQLDSPPQPPAATAAATAAAAAAAAVLDGLRRRVNGGGGVGKGWGNGGTDRYRVQRQREQRGGKRGSRSYCRLSTKLYLQTILERYPQTFFLFLVQR